MVFYHPPEQIRVGMVRTYGQRRGTPLEVLGPAGAWWLKERIVGSISILLGHSVRAAEAKGSKAVLHVTDKSRLHAPCEQLQQDRVLKQYCPRRFERFACLLTLWLSRLWSSRRDHGLSQEPTRSSLSPCITPPCLPPIRRIGFFPA